MDKSFGNNSNPALRLQYRPCCRPFFLIGIYWLTLADIKEKLRIYGDLFDRLKCGASDAKDAVARFT